MKLDELTPDRLRVLYQDELISDTEIAARYGTYQVRVSRLRSRWGIQTLSKAERLERKLPPLTPYQEEVLTGSLLGDGWLDPTSGAAARFGENHALSQESYLQWKAQVLQPYSRPPYDTSKREDGKEHLGRGFMTCSCPQLRVFYDLFYYQGKRRFPEDLPARMTPLVLAVWYMDDGSVTKRGRPRISFGLGSVNLRRAVLALRELGLKPRVYGEGGDQGIHFPRQEREFRELVEPHVIPEMAYKLPWETERRKMDRNARKLTPEEARSLYEGGLSKRQIASIFGVGEGTVGRRLQMAGAQMRRSGPRRRRVGPAAADAMLASYKGSRWETLTEEEKSQWEEDIFKLLREHGFPFPAVPAAEEAQNELARLRDVELGLDENKAIRPWSMKGLPLCGPFFPNRFTARWRGKKTAFESWHLDKDLRRALRFQLDCGDPVRPHRVLRAITMQCRTPTVFKPVVARYLYETYCPPGGTVWDPCAGYGGRLLGAVAAGVKYIGTEVEPETVEGNLKLLEVLGCRHDGHLVLEHPAESFEPPAVDFVFTSPPYFDVERYGAREDQSSRRYETFDDWTEGFLRPATSTAHRALPLGGHLALNVADIGLGKRKSLPLVERTTEVAVEVGFELVETLQMPIAVLNRKARSEPILIFRK